MSDTISFYVPGKPIPQGSMTHVGNGRMIHKPELIQWRLLVHHLAVIAARRAGWTLPIDEPVSIKATFWLERPKRPRWDVPAVKPDLDKLCRAIGDALSPKNGAGVLAEDSRIVAWDVAKNYRDQPGVDIEITRLGRR